VDETPCAPHVYTLPLWQNRWLAVQMTGKHVAFRQALLVAAQSVPPDS
jgi:hypothetical protein